MTDDQDEDALEDALNERFTDAILNDEPDVNGWQAAYLQGYPLADVLARAIGTEE